jgi:hypothetical protein
MPSFRILLTCAAVAVLSACAPTTPGSLSDAPQLQTPPADWTPADQPVVWNSFDDYAHLELSMPDAVRSQPYLYSNLRSADVAELRAFGRESRETQADLHPSERQAYTLIIGYDAPFETDRLYSLESESWSYTGGAHGNPAHEGVLWDKVRQRRVAATALFRPGADMAVLDRALCDAVNRAKRDRLAEARRADPTAQAWDAVTLTPAEGAIFSCPRALDMAISLAPGTVAGKAGGLGVVIGPYVVGPYAEGSYAVVVPLDAFAALLAPEWADQFAGAPAPST